ncbi:MAG TPA: phosphate transport system regulatory protein PhoU [Candidatus Marinimicrobia bacterium]|nr:MAG: phosphate transport system regulatory protein PhoU [Candidatus Marinimicrobia bacterium CG1_02_48_14]PIZ67365.1 MAG: phosphate transport system regulatory protein PhoU [Candidatus Marinimicrobia bacterium CG_4_10_14_0_2_um_filter_48_9]HCW77175.1 phosphate transport system regulatory protein PhoU [Candidatus Neomarinimicrobiota bacterium]
MPKHLQREIENLKKKILHVGARVEESLQSAMKALHNFDEIMAQTVIDGDQDIDALEVDVEEDCLKILALHQPVAIDLRFIVSVLKINNDLERIGDLATNIAERVQALVPESQRVTIPSDIPELARRSLQMVKLSLDSLVAMDVDLARNVCRSDEEVDILHRKMYRFTEDNIAADPLHTPSFIQVLGISRYLERIADHATNIAEDVIYMVEGEITRHRMPS